MSEILLIRHGETAWNTAEIFRGRADVPLNEAGRTQAERLSEYLSRKKIDTVYASPLARARETAEIIAGRHGLGVKNVPEIIDIDFGEWQGLSHQEVKERYGELYRRWLEHPEGVKFPGGESLAEVRERAESPVQRLAAGGEEVTAALVAHRVVNKVLICALLGLDESRFWNIRQDTGGITTFNYEKGRFILTGHNDTSFLGAAEHAKPGDF